MRVVKQHNIFTQIYFKVSGQSMEMLSGQSIWSEYGNLMSNEKSEF